MSLFSPLQEFPVNIVVLTVVFILLEWFGREKQFALVYYAEKFSRPVRWGMYLVLVMVTAYYAGQEQQFIYFQF